eukprot:scaffold17205_cov186-Amphora_coffeaeformis.AAC.20
MMTVRKIAFCTAWLLASLPIFSAFTTVETTGPYVTGVRDFDLLDTVYPSELHPNDAAGRRIMFRVYYPTCAKTDLDVLEGIDGNTSVTCNDIDLGSKRKYLEAEEWQVYFGIPEPTQISPFFDETQSYKDAPIDVTVPSHTFPVVIYSHGFGSYVSDNTALLEELASHGYIVCAVASPGFAGGVLYPSDGHFITTRDDYPEINAMMSADAIPNPYLANYTDDLQIRYERMELYLEQGALPMLVQRLNDDLVATVDHLDAVSKTSRAATSTKSMHEEVVSSFNTIDPFLVELLGRGTTEGLDGKIIYMGFSLGGSAAGSAAQADVRAVGAINLDGGHQSLDLWNTEIRTPYLMFFEQTEIAWFYHGEFLFETLASMGNRTDIIRVLGPEGVQHNDYTDQKLFSSELRAGLLDITASVDGLRVHNMLARFCLGFLNRYLVDDGEWDTESIFTSNNQVEEIDVSYVAEWARERSATEEPTVNEDSSSATIVLNFWFAFIFGIAACFLQIV